MENIKADVIGGYGSECYPIVGAIHESPAIVI